MAAPDAEQPRAPSVAMERPLDQGAPPSMTTVDRRAAEALKKRVVAVLNPASGGVDTHAEARTKEIFTQAGLPHAEVVSAGPAEIDAALAKAVAEADVLVVLGGDGTIR